MKKRFYSDMDGVLAKFELEKNAVNRYATEEHFFKNLLPSKLCLKINKRLGKDSEFRENFYIITASPNIRCDLDKLVWLHKHIPNMKKTNVILCRNGEVKADFVEDITNSILLDDYSQNLIEWAINGGQPIKYVNETDNKIGRHTSYKIPFVKNYRQLRKMINQ